MYDNVVLACDWLAS